MVGFHLRIPVIFIVYIWIQNCDITYRVTASRGRDFKFSW